MALGSIQTTYREILTNATRFSVPKRCGMVLFYLLRLQGNNALGRAAAYAPSRSFSLWKQLTSIPDNLVQAFDRT